MTYRLGYSDCGDPYSGADPHAESPRELMETYLDEEFGPCTCPDNDEPSDLCERCREQSSIESAGEP